jgi:hypothetical protein
MALARLVLTAMLAASALGCHTIAAVRQIREASPAFRVTLSSNDPRELSWVARYGESGYPDNIGAFFSRDVDRAGTWVLARPVHACVFSDSVFRRVTGEPVELREPHGELLEPPSPDRRDAAAKEGCTDLVMLRRGRGLLEIAAVELIDVSDASELRLALPRESPAVDPRRWLWLVSAPVFDALTLVALPPFAVALVVADSIDSARD